MSVPFQASNKICSVYVCTFIFSDGRAITLEPAFILRCFSKFYSTVVNNRTNTNYDFVNIIRYGMYDIQYHYCAPSILNRVVPI